MKIEKKQLFEKRIDEIYELYYEGEIKKQERERIKIENEFLHFIKQSVTEEEYEKIWNYIEKISSKTNNITNLWNKQFYYSGFKDSKDILINMIKNINNIH